MKPPPHTINCGAFGDQDFTCYFKADGSLDACYAWFDREEEINFKPELSPEWRERLEREEAERLPKVIDEMTLAKNRDEEEMAG